MAFASPQLWLCEFRVPADDYRYLHLAQHTGLNDEAFTRRKLLGQLSPDVRIERLYRIKSALETQNRLAEIVEAGKGEYRPLSGEEPKLSRAEVDALGGPVVTGGQIVVPSEADVARALDAASR